MGGLTGGSAPRRALLLGLLLSASVLAPRAEAQDAETGMALVQAATHSACLGDTAAEADALRRLAEAHFWTPPVVALARWTLESVPPNAILLAQTDGDGVPLRMLQMVEALRPDVQVVQVDVVGDSSASALVATWETSARPIVGALTLDPVVLGAHAPNLVMAGAYQRPGTITGAPFDLAAAEASADAVRGADFVGPRTSPGDTDPARRASPVDLSGVVLFTLLQTAVSHAQAGDAAAAERAYARAVTFAREARIADDPLVGTARDWIDEALASHPDRP